MLQNVTHLTLILSGWYVLVFFSFNIYVLIIESFTHSEFPLSVTDRVQKVLTLSLSSKFFQEKLTLSAVGDCE